MCKCNLGSSEGWTDIQPCGQTHRQAYLLTDDWLASMNQNVLVMNYINLIQFLFVYRRTSLIYILQSVFSTSSSSSSENVNTQSFILITLLTDQPFVRKRGIWYWKRKMWAYFMERAGGINMSVIRFCALKPFCISFLNSRYQWQAYRVLWVQCDTQYIFVSGSGIMLALVGVGVCVQVLRRIWD